MTDKELSIIRILVALIIELCGVLGFTLPISENAVYCCVAIVVMSAVFVWTAWKNHNLSDAASKTQILLDAIKAGDADISAGVDELVELAHRGQDAE